MQYIYLGDLSNLWWVWYVQSKPGQHYLQVGRWFSASKILIWVLSCSIIQAIFSFYYQVLVFCWSFLLINLDLNHICILLVMKY